MPLLFYQLNAYFSLLFLSWCLGLLLGIPHFDLKEYTVALWVFYAVVFVAVLFNYIISTQQAQQKHIIFLISGIVGFTVFTVVHFFVSCYYARHMYDVDQESRLKAQGMLFFIVPTMSNGIFGIVLTLFIYFQKRHQHIVKISWRGYPVITGYSIVAILMSTHILNFVYTNYDDVSFRQDLILSNTAIIVAAAFIIVAFVTFIRQFYYGGLIALCIAGIIYGNLALKMIYYMFDMYRKDSPDDVKKAYAWFMHSYTVLIYIFTGIYLCYCLGKRDRSKESRKSEPKININIEELFPSTLFTQKY